MPAKNSPPTAATAVQSASMRKASENHNSRDEHREEPLKGGTGQNDESALDQS